jgi:hypothetical protein
MPARLLLLCLLLGSSWLTVEGGRQVGAARALIGHPVVASTAVGRRETYSNGVCKVLYRDPDGNELGFGGAPVDTAS